MKKSIHAICANFTAARELKENGLYTYYRPIASGQDPVVTQKYGTSCSGSRFLNGTLDIHEELEAKLAKLVGKKNAVTFSTGFQVNLGVVSTLGVRDGFIFLDSLDHACIIDGARLSFSKVLKFAHNDMEMLENRLRRVPRKAHKLVVVDGVYSMEGDIAPMPDLVHLCDKYNAALMVDDAHGLGVLGTQGRGTANHFGLTDRVDLIMGTFSKSFGSLGGFIASDGDIVDYIKNTARSLIFSASMPPANVAAVSKAIDIMLTEPERLENLWKVTRHAQEAFRAAGFDIGRTQSPIIPLFVRDTVKAMQIVNEALDEGIFITPVIAPAVPENDVLIRFALMATHTEDQVDEAVEKLTRIFKTHGVIA